MTRALCPHCGFDLARDKPIVIGDWRMTPVEAEYQGRRVNITRQQAFALFTIAKARPHPISSEAMLNRISSGETENVVSVVMCKLRRRLPTVPFVTQHGSGYRWSDA